MSCRHRAHADLHPADAALEPARRAHGIRKLAATEASRGSFDEAAAAIARTTDQAIGKRQVESLTARAAADVEDFYASRRPPPAPRTDVLVVSADGKGIVMRPDSLRPQPPPKPRRRPPRSFPSLLPSIFPWPSPWGGT